MLAKVFLDGDEVEHHYWNRIGGLDLDLTREQFLRGEEIVEVDVVPHDVLAGRMDTIKPDVLERITTLRARVAAILMEKPPRP